MSFAEFGDCPQFTIKYYVLQDEDEYKCYFEKFDCDKIHNLILLLFGLEYSHYLTSNKKYKRATIYARYGDHDKRKIMTGYSKDIYNNYLKTYPNAKEIDDQKLSNYLEIIYTRLLY